VAAYRWRPQHFLEPHQAYRYRSFTLVLSRRCRPRDRRPAPVDNPMLRRKRGFTQTNRMLSTPEAVPNIGARNVALLL
jgi:hypothetical protein